MEVATLASSLVHVLTDPAHWRDRAACKGMNTDLFFSKGGVHPEARKACQRCPVRTDCLESQVAWEKARGDSRTAGFVGGMTAKQRERTFRYGRWATAAAS